MAIASTKGRSSSDGTDRPAWRRPDRDRARRSATRLETVPSLLVSIGAPRLRRLGYDVPLTAPEPEHRLYALLARNDPAAAHSRYNGLIRRLVSFERAAECVR